MRLFKLPDMLLMVAGLIAGLLAPPAAAQAPRPLPVRVADDSYVVFGLPALGNSGNRNFISNAAFVVTPEGVVVIDALGSPPLARELLEEIRRVTPAPVRYLVLTHYHADHIYGAQVFQEAGATIIAQAGGAAYLNSEAAAQRLTYSRSEMAPAVDAQTRLVAADRWLDGPMTLTLGGLDFVIQPMGPAHTAEDVVVWVPQRRLLIAGDLVFRARLPFVGQADSTGWLAAIERLLALDAQVVVPGHGPVSAQPATDLAQTADYLRYLQRTMGEAARDMVPFDEAYARTDWSRYERLPLFGAANRMNAYNTYLLMERGAK